MTRQRPNPALNADFAPAALRRLALRWASWAIAVATDVPFGTLHDEEDRE